MHNWKNKFRKIILERGEDYCYGGLVCDLKKEDYGYSAVVKGSEDYNVDIYIENDEVTDMDCDCPYACDGNNCKHMAAVLFTIENDGMIIERHKEQQSIEEIIDSMSEEDLRKEFLEIVRNEPNIRNRIFNTYRNSSFYSGDIYRFSKNLEALAYEYGDRHGFIDYRSGYDYVDAFSGCLSDYIGPMIKKGEYDLAFEAIKKAIDVLINVEMDGSGGEHSMLAADISAYLKDVLESCDKKIRDNIHRWIKEVKDLEYYYIVQDELDEIYEHSFNDEEYLLEMLDDVKEKINDPKREKFYLRHDLDLYKSVLNRLGKDDSEYERWLNYHDDLTTVIEIRLDEAREKEDIEKTIDILERMVSDKRFFWKNDYYRELIDLYIRKEDHDRQKDTLIRILEYENYSRLDDLYRLKEYCNKEEWIKHRNNCIENNAKLRPELYLKEKMFKELAECLKDYPIDITDKYAKYLNKDYSKQVFERYLSYLYELEKRNPSRSLYEEMKKYCRIALKYDDNKKVA